MQVHVSDEREGQVLRARAKWKDFMGQGELWEDKPPYKHKGSMVLPEVLQR